MSVAFAVGTGRCGTTLVSRLAALDPQVASSHERQRLAACYHMFTKWHHVPSDPEGFLRSREELVRSDLADHSVSFESSALLSHSLLELHARFDARFVLLVRRPDHTVASFAARGWFQEPIAWHDRSLPPTLPDGMVPRHFFGRNLPRGAAFDDWLALTPIGRIAWFWQARNGAILEQFGQLPPGACRVQRIEDLDHAAWIELAAFLGWTSTVDLAAFEALASGRINTGPNPPIPTADWPGVSVSEFEAQVASVASALGYEPRAGATAGPRSVADVLACLASS